VRDEEDSVWQTKPERERKEETKQSRWGFRGKTVWDFLQLLIVPLMLVAIGLVFSLQQDVRQQRVENQRAKAERELAEQRAQDEALQAYLDQMSGLLLERDLRTSEEDSEVRTLARARTLTVLGRLDPSRKTAVMQFLVEAELVTSADGREPIIALDGASLSNADLSFLGLRNADLTGADLSGANLNGADLSNADLGATKKVTLSGGGLLYPVRANLSGANLSFADLSGADLRFAVLSHAHLSGADLSGADLSGAFLRDADLRETYLIETILSDTDLSDAKLSDAIIRGAKLRHARGVTDEQLLQAKTLEDTTMPDGSIHQ
jgi:hypothetical protein